MKNIFVSGVIGLSLMAAPVALAAGLDDAMANDRGSVMVSAAAPGEVESGAQQFIDVMAAKAIGFLGDSNLSESARKKEFRQLLRAHYDVKSIGRFALGRYWRTASAAQQAQYAELFEDMLVDVYSARFGEYKGQKLKISGTRQDAKSGDVIVKSSVLPNGSGEKVDVDWRVRYKNGEYRVIDVIVAGVSMAMTHRSDFASVIQKGGGKVDVLIDHLKNHG